MPMGPVFNKTVQNHWVDGWRRRFVWNSSTNKNVKFEKHL
jgi:hypothetical protein